VHILTAADVKRLATPDLVLAAQEQAYASFSDGSAIIPPRSEIHRTDPAGVALIMSGLIGHHTLGVKLIANVDPAPVTAIVKPPAPPARHTTCMILVWDAATLAPRGLIDADALNDERSAAGIAVATRLLARPDSATHALFGAGKLAAPCAAYIARIRPIRRLILVGRTKSRIDALVQRLRDDPMSGHTEIVTNLGADEAAGQADIITTVTTSSAPVFDGRRVRPGTHINLGGAMRRHEREMDDHAARQADFFVDAEVTTMERAGDIVMPLEQGVMTKAQIKGEIGRVILKQIPGRTRPDQITAFRSMGIAAQDLCLAAALLDQAEAQKIGQKVKL